MFQWTETPERKDDTPNDKLLISLEKQLNIEMKVKNGAENMIQSISGAHHGRDKKLLAEAQQMLADSKAKIEFLKLRILKVRRNGQSSKVSIAFNNLFSHKSSQMTSRLSFSGGEWMCVLLFIAYLYVRVPVHTIV